MSQINKCNACSVATYISILGTAFTLLFIASKLLA